MSAVPSESADGDTQVSEGSSPASPAAGAVRDPDSQSQLMLLGMQQRSECGYCGSANGSRFLGMRAPRLTCGDYQELIDRGWRRSGTLLYLTDHSDSCCAYYTIRTHALEYKLEATDKKILRKMRQHAATAEAGPTNEEEEEDELMRRVRGIEVGGLFEVRLERAGFSEEKYRVFEKYQVAVHGDEDATRHGFKRFLCDSPLQYQPVAQSEPSGLPLSVHGLGSYHQCYYLGGRLVAVGVLDILPHCVSSVYLFYDPEYAHLSLGKYSALREIALVRQLHAQQESFPELRYYYMGYYIPTCPKMKYKERWRPADLLDLVTLKWVPIERCVQRIARHPVFCTFDPRVDSLGIVRDRRDRILETAPRIDPALVTPEQRRALGHIAVFVFWTENGMPKYGVAPAAQVAKLEGLEALVLQMMASIGEELARRVILSIQM
ncbi:Arginyl-tRNA--protein transferase 1 [Coemansia thaxteri]|uniref:Arginyl-tRNA--protein transferase 1 n=1 Tax=Coemansia thaxteri TaxID=2663907 RepID=A0A9W8BGN8_9FUNG|nr:Arginyl-tRNA--protein transferase 1 [Coemansia thaxteri]KAJ2001369.1 Arginyl-tRNA--protein transferase 1 [Coemansia thaxteri]KAJ2465239.1 Arginyl-tRNA--protein transferase 1 [Coemansia sp. RSA 2322]KAJ2483450.1 Arginyl-tRNA--protein transferase 1 [Coemansia sp. RSA 2320]